MRFEYGSEKVGGLKHQNQNGVDHLVGRLLYTVLQVIEFFDLNLDPLILSRI